ncbi:MAG: dihydroneopterin aldolase family protein, partial [Promethearchaeota archaeon]
LNINREQIQGDKSSEFEYDEITGKHIEAKIVLEFKSVEVIAKIEWIEELKYPLMFIEKILNKD